MLNIRKINQGPSNGMIRIGIDTQIANVSRAGIGQVTTAVSRLLPTVDANAAYVPLAPSHSRDLSMPQRWWWDQVTLPRLARRERIDVVLKPGFSCPVRSSIPTVMIVNDLAARRFPHQLHKPSAWFYGRWAPWTYRRAAHLIAISEFTAREIISELGIARNKISVMMQAVDREAVAPGANDGKHLAAHDLAGKKFVLHIGTIEPRKNLAFLVRTFATFRAKHPEYLLVLAGAEGWLSTDVREAVASRDLSRAVVFTGSVTEEAKFALLRNARALAFPSFYEGFGRPPLEAMACGTPVVASRSSSIPEVVGDAGILLSGYDEDEWVRSLEAAAEDGDTRTRLIAAGPLRSRTFTWERAARQIADILHDVAHG